MSQPYPTDIEAICNHCEQRYADAGDLGRLEDEDDYQLFCPKCGSDDITLLEVA